MGLTHLGQCLTASSVEEDVCGPLAAHSITQHTYTHTHTHRHTHTDRHTHTHTHTHTNTHTLSLLLSLFSSLPSPPLCHHTRIVHPEQPPLTVSPLYESIRENVVNAELVLLRQIGFDTQHDNPLLVCTPPPPAIPQTLCVSSSNQALRCHAVFLWLIDRFSTLGCS